MKKAVINAKIQMKTSENRFTSFKIILASLFSFYLKVRGKERGKEGRRTELFHLLIDSPYAFDV